jgi:mono/diheme cytochrome c family protein
VLVVLSMGTLTYKGATAKEALGAELIALVPSWAEKEGFANDATAVEGAKLFAQSACLNCHTYNNVGGSQYGAPDLTAEGTKNRGMQWQIDHLKSPSSKTPGSPMPSFAGFTEQQLKELAKFLEASKGAH